MWVCCKEAWVNVLRNVKQQQSLALLGAMHLAKAWVLRREKNRNSIRWSEPHPQDVFTSVCCTAQPPFKCCHVDGAYDNIITMDRHILTTCHYHFNAKYVINWVVHFETSLKVKPWQPTGSSWKCNWIIVATIGLCTIIIYQSLSWLSFSGFTQMESQFCAHSGIRNWGICVGRLNDQRKATKFTDLHFVGYLNTFRPALIWCLVLILVTTSPFQFCNAAIFTHSFTVMHRVFFKMLISPTVQVLKTKSLKRKK